MTFGRLQDLFPDSHIMDEPLDSLSRGQSQTLAKTGAVHAAGILKRLDSHDLRIPAQLQLAEVV
ncbi:MAG: hypothetical protein V3V01_13375 [Acidimicrobiales bacterium]